MARDTSRWITLLQRWLSVSGLLGCSFLPGVTPATSNASDQHVPGAATSFMVRVPWPYQQKYTASCEAAASHVVLSMFGHSVSEQQLLDELPVDTRLPRYGKGGLVTRWGNPYLAFVGDVARGDKWPLQGYGVYEPPILALLRHNGLPASYGGSGFTEDEVRAALQQGYPVIVWVPKLSLYQAKRTFVRRTWVAWDGTTIIWNEWEHAQIVVGYNASGPFLYNTDSDRYSHNQWFWHYTWAQFQRGWDVLGDQAVVTIGASPLPIRHPTPIPTPGTPTSSPLSATPTLPPASPTSTPPPTTQPSATPTVTPTPFSPTIPPITTPSPLTTATPTPVLPGVGARSP